MSNNNGPKAALAPTSREEARSGDISDHESPAAGQASDSHPIHAAQQPQMPQRFPAPRTQVQAPDTPCPAASHSGDPNPRIGSMHNLAPQFRGPSFPARRGPIYFPSDLVSRPVKSQTMTQPDTSSPPSGSKSLQKGRPQEDWKQLIGSNADKEKQNDGTANSRPSEKPQIKGYYRPKGSPFLLPKRGNPSQPSKRPDFVPSKVSPIPESPAGLQQARPSLMQIPGLIHTAKVHDPVVNSSLFPAQDQQVSPSQQEPGVVRDADHDVIMSDAPQDVEPTPFPQTPTLAAASAAQSLGHEDIFMADATEFVPAAPAPFWDEDLPMQDPVEPDFSDLTSRGLYAPLGLPVVSPAAAAAHPFSPRDATPMVDVQTLPIARKRRIDQVDDAELPEGASGDPVDVVMSDVDVEEDVQMGEEAPSGGDVGQDVPMQDGTHGHQAQPAFTFRFPSALGQIGSGFKSAWSRATRVACRIFQSVKRRAVEAYGSSARRLRRRRASTTARRSGGVTTEPSAARAVMARSDEPKTAAKAPRRPSSPSKSRRRHSPKAEQLARVNKTPRKSRPCLSVARGPAPVSPKERRRRAAIEKELMRQWAMPAADWLREEETRTGIPADAPCVPATHGTAGAEGMPTTQEPQADAETPSEEPYEGFMHSPRGRAPPQTSDWMAADASGSCLRRTDSTPTTVEVDAGEHQEPAGHEQAHDGIQTRRSPRSHGEPFIQPLTEAWEARLETAMNGPESRQLATTLRGDPLTRRDLATCTVPMAWLNDEIINSYLEIVVDQARRKAGNSGRHDQPKYHAFNSFFYSNLRDKGYESVRRWASRAKIGGSALLNVDTIFVPVHDHSHWTLIVVKPAARTIEHFDSLGSPSRAHAGRVRSWIRSELGSLFKDDEWRILPSTSPQQNNGSDCGVFLLTTAKLVAFDLPLQYGAKDIPGIRKRIAAELMNGGFEGDFDPDVEFHTKAML